MTTRAMCTSSIGIDPVRVVGVPIIPPLTRSRTRPLPAVTGPGARPAAQHGLGRPGSQSGGTRHDAAQEDDRREPVLLPHERARREAGPPCGGGPHADVLDFFAGSGTTAHALLMLNGEDGGNRRFILVNNDELTKGRGRAQKRICEEICLPRVRAAIDGYDYRERGRTVHVDGLPGNFRYYHVEVAGSGAERSGHGAPDVAWDEPVGQANQHT